MKTFRRIALALALVLTVAGTASAQFRFGVRAGIQTNSLHFEKSTFDDNNRVGFTGGVMAEFTVPVVGVGADLSLMYTHRNQGIATMNADGTDVEKDRGLNYIEIPLNLKWKMSIPVIQKIVRPYIFTGPSFAFLTSKRAISDAVKNKSCDVAWNVGFGVELFSHLQASACYGFGMTKAFDFVGVTEANAINARTRCWTITAAYLF